MTGAAFRGGRGREAFGRGESSGAVCPTRKAAPGGARQGQKGHGVDARLALRRDGPDAPLRPDAEGAPTQRNPCLHAAPTSASCGSCAGGRSEMADRPPRSSAVTHSSLALPPHAPRHGSAVRQDGWPCFCAPAYRRGSAWSGTGVDTRTDPFSCLNQSPCQEPPSGLDGARNGLLPRLSAAAGRRRRAHSAEPLPPRRTHPRQPRRTLAASASGMGLGKIGFTAGWVPMLGWAAGKTRPSLDESYPEARTTGVRAKTRAY